MLVPKKSHQAHGFRHTRVSRRLLGKQKDLQKERGKCKCDNCSF